MAEIEHSLVIAPLNKEDSDAKQIAEPKSHSWIKMVVRKAVTMFIVTVVFGWLYSWASPWAFSQNRVAGFKYGMLHGMMMPLSLPSLVIGREVAIYDTNNSGRNYKIGYICGVNICGIVFIGPLFWRPRVKSASSEKSR